MKVKVLGHRVYLKLPELKESKVIVSKQVKKEAMTENTQLDYLEVLAIGSHVTDNNLQVGDKVFVTPKMVNEQNVVEIEGQFVLCVNIYDIMHVWDK